MSKVKSVSKKSNSRFMLLAKNYKKSVSELEKLIPTFKSSTIKRYVTYLRSLEKGRNTSEKMPINLSKAFFTVTKKSSSDSSSSSARWSGTINGKTKKFRTKKELLSFLSSTARVNSISFVITK